MMTSAPASANANTISRPRPRLPPVTNATLPSRLNRSAMLISTLLAHAPAHPSVRLPCPALSLRSLRPTARPLPWRSPSVGPRSLDDGGQLVRRLHRDDVSDARQLDVAGPRDHDGQPHP